MILHMLTSLRVLEDASDGLEAVGHTLCSRSHAGNHVEPGKLIPCAASYGEHMSVSVASVPLEGTVALPLVGMDAGEAFWGSQLPGPPYCRLTHLHQVLNLNNCKRESKRRVFVPHETSLWEQRSSGAQQQTSRPAVLFTPNGWFGM